MPRTLLALAIVALFLNGCGLMAPMPVFMKVDAHVSPENSSAVVENEGGVRITHIDGELVRDISGGRVSKGIYLSPGDHEFSFHHIVGSSLEAGKIVAELVTGTFTATLIKGHSYIPTVSSTSSENVTVTLRDMGTSYKSDCLISPAYRPEGTTGCAP